MQSYLIVKIFLIFSSILHHSTAIPPHRVPYPPHNSLVESISDRVNSDSAESEPPKPKKFFEVTKPIQRPNTTPCTHLILQHDFAFTYGKPPATAPYSPPSHCSTTTHFSTIILEFSATCRGRQFDRILGVWLGGVELLRSCTAEPTPDGILWKVQKDVSRYHSLLMTPNQTLSVYLGNVVDQTYTGVYHVNVSMQYYPPEVEKVSDFYGDWADLILPISRNRPLNDGLWFEIKNFAQVRSKKVVIPQNVYRAVLEVYVSYHENDEFWDGNLPNGYLVANNMSQLEIGNGNFREVLVSLDGDLIGAVCPFTVIFTGGVNPLLWRPISGIGSFDLPSYDIEVTPFLGKLLDGKKHSFRFSVTNSLNVWFVDANLHLWVDSNREVVWGELLQNKAEPLSLFSSSDFRGLDGEFVIRARRVIETTGWVESSHGNITTSSIQKFDFENNMVLKNEGNLQIVNRSIDFNSSVVAVMPSSGPFFLVKSHKWFPLYYYGDQTYGQGNNRGYTLVNNVTLGFNEDKESSSSSSTSLRNEQQGNGIMVVKHGLVVSGVAGTHQIYRFEDSSGNFCYFRNVSSYNYTILYDEVSDKCRDGRRNHISGLVNLVESL